VHDEFSDWYRIGNIDPKDVDLKARWAGISEFAENADVDDVLDAARVFFRGTAKAGDFESRFRAPVKAADDKFQMIGNAAEVRILCGAFLVAMFRYSRGWRELAALALTVGGYRGTRAAPVADIVRVAREEVARLSISLRASTEKDPPAAQPFAEDLAKKFDELSKIFQANGALSTVNEQLQSTLKALTTAITDSLSWQHLYAAQQSLRREESDVLWWLFAGRSRDLEVGFDELKATALALVAAKEMADLTRSLPGPYATRGFLFKALSAAKQHKGKVTLSDAVSAVPPTWREQVSQKTATDTDLDLCPTLCAARKCHEADGKKTWYYSFEQTTGVKATIELSALDLAQQAYEEWLLTRAARSLRD
jgi:hypothetical protein